MAAVGRDLAANVDVVASLVPKAQTATGTGTAVSLAGYDSAMAVINYGAYTDGTHTPTIQHSDDSGTTWADAGTDSALTYWGTLSAITPFTSAATGSGLTQRVGFNSNIKGTVRVLNTVTAGTTGALIGANIVRSNPNLGPLA